MPAARSRRFPPPWLRGDRGALALLVVVFFGANFQLLSGRGVPHWDGSDFFAPFYSLLARLTRGGHLLSWNPLSAGGSPDFAEPQVGAFSPVTLLFGWIAGPGPLAFNLYWLGLWLFGGLGMYVLARALSAPPWGALLTALGLVFSGYYLGHAEHTSVVYSYSFVPWILWRLRAGLVTGRRWPACQAGALWGLSALAGNPAVVIPAALFLAVVAPAWLAERPGISWGARCREYALSMAVVALVGVVILAPSYASFRYEIAGFSDRSRPLPRETVLALGVGFDWLGALANPLVVLATGPGPTGVSADPSMLPVYFGSVLPVLALFGMRRGRRSRSWTWVVAAAGGLCLGVSLGASLPLRGWLYDLVPPTRFFRHPTMFRGFFILATAMLAADGARVIDERVRRGAETPGNSLRPLAVGAGACGVAALAAVLWVFSTTTNDWAARLAWLAELHAGIAWFGLAAVCAAAVRWAGCRRWLPAALVALSVGDLVATYVLSRGMVYTVEPLAAAAAVPAPVGDPGPAGFGRYLGKYNNDNLYQPHPTLVSYAAMTNDLLAAWRQDHLLAIGVLGTQRIWFSPTAPCVPPSPEGFAAFRDRVHELRGLVLLRHDPAAMLESGLGRPLPDAARAAIAAAPRAQLVPYQVSDYRADDLSLRVTCPQAGFLLVTDRWARSWTATVNGRPVPVEGGDFLFRLVPVAAGENLVVMQFRLPWLFPLVALSWATLAAVGLGGCWPSRRAGKFLPPAVPGIRPALLKQTVGAAS